MSILIEKSETYCWEAAVRGARNPKNSWNKIDSHYDNEGHYILGSNDLKLLETLSNAGTDHGKFLRQIQVTMDVTAPLYWYKEYDTYKVGTVANSCSTMHKLTAKPFEMSDFSSDHLLRTESKASLENIVNYLNKLRNEYLEETDDAIKKLIWYEMIQLLPTSFNQKRTMSLNYAVLKNIYHARHNHKLDEWHVFCDWIKTLPYAQELIICDGTKRKEESCASQYEQKNIFNEWVPETQKRGK